MNGQADISVNLEPPRAWISEQTLFEIQVHLHNCFPYEGCGLLFGTQNGVDLVVNHFEPGHNVSAKPEHHFSLDPAFWVKHVYSGNLLGIVHSHPAAPPIPSHEDIRQLQQFGTLFRLYCIASTSRDAERKKDSNMSAYTVHLEPDGQYGLQQAALLRMTQENI